jgi:hypothetical protein
LDVTDSDDGRFEPGEPEPDGEDARLLAELRELGRVFDPVPAEVIFAARGSLAWRRVDAELAELAFDSSVDRELELAGVRGGDDVRLVSFEGPELTVEVEIASDGDHRRLVGQLVPPQAATVELRTPAASAGAGTPAASAGAGSPAASADAGSRVTQADGLGRFILDRVTAGPASLRCVLAPGHAVETGWLLI